MGSTSFRGPVKRVLYAIAVIVVVIAVLGSIAIVVAARSQQNERRAIEQLRRQFGRGFAFESECIGPDWIQRRGPEWLVDRLERVVAITIDAEAANPEVLRSFPYLEELDLRGCNLSDRELNDLLPTLRHLRSLYLSDTSCTGVCIAALPVQSLDELLLDRTPLSDTGLGAIANLSSVGELSLSGCKSVTAQGIELLSNSFIVELNLSQCNLEDSAVSIVSSMKHLRTLNLSDNPITGELFGKYAKGMQVIDLNLSNTLVTDTQLKSLSQAERIEYLELDGTAITLEGIVSLSKLPNLKFLSIANTEIGDEAIDVLQNLVSLSILVIGDNQFSAEALAKLTTELPELQIREQSDIEGDLSEQARMN